MRTTTASNYEAMLARHASWLVDVKRYAAQRYPARAADWQTPALENDWTMLDPPVRYFRDGQSFVTLEGWAAHDNAYTNPITVFTLPLGYRPPADIHVPHMHIAVVSGDNLAATVLIHVLATGEVQFDTGTSTLEVNTLPFDGIRFQSDPTEGLTL